MSKVKLSLILAFAIFIGAIGGGMSLSIVHAQLPPSAVGRYAIYQHSSMRADQFLLDTQTGRVWRCTQDSASAKTFWNEMDKQNNK